MGNKRVVVVGRNYCNILTMVRALGEAGHSVDVLRLFKKKPRKLNLLGNMKPEAHSKYVRSFNVCVVNGEIEKAVEAMLRLVSDEKIVLIPVDDYSAYIVDDYLESLEPKYILPNINCSQGKINGLMNKHMQKKLAKEFGLPVLNSSLLETKDDKFDIPEEIEYPCFVKPNVSMNSTKNMMMKCDNKEELHNFLEKYEHIEKCQMLVEKFVHIKNEYSILGCSFGDRSISPCIFKVLKAGHKERKGVTLLGEIIDGSKFESIVKKCNDFVVSLRYTGLFDIDLIETENGEMFFIELNFRAGASTYAFNQVGVNLAKIYIDGLNKIDLENISVNKYGKYFLSEKILLEEFARSDISYKNARKMLKNADLYLMKSEEDFKPYGYFKKYYLIAFFMKIPYKIRDFIRKL